MATRVDIRVAIRGIPVRRIIMAMAVVIMAGVIVVTGVVLTAAAMEAMEEEEATAVGTNAKNRESEKILNGNPDHHPMTVGIEAERFPFTDDIHADEAVRTFQFIDEGRFSQPGTPRNDWLSLRGFDGMQQAHAYAVNVRIRKAADALDGVFVNVDFWMTVGVAEERGKGGGKTGVIRTGIEQHIYKERPAG